MTPEYDALVEMIRLSDRLYRRGITFDHRDPKPMMVYHMFCKQREHAKSIRLLVRARQDRDALLIARAALEAYASLTWAADDFETRAKNWLGFGVVEELRFQLKLDERKEPKIPEIRKQINELLSLYATDLVKPEYKERMDGNSKKKQVPVDRYVDSWHGFESTEQLFAAAGQSQYYQHFDRSSKWMHSKPRATAYSVNDEWSDAESLAGYSKDAELAVLISTNALLHALKLVAEYFASIVQEADLKAIQSFRRRAAEN